jgi:hypothetical protein
VTSIPVAQSLPAWRARARGETQSLRWSGGGCALPAEDALLDALLVNLVTASGSDWALEVAPAARARVGARLQALEAGPVGLLRRRLHPGTSPSLDGPLRQSLNRPPAPVRPAGRRPLRSIGVDLGGSDMKVVVMEGDAPRLEVAHPWVIAPWASPDPAAWAPQIDAILADLLDGVEAPALGLSLPDVVWGGVVRGGLTGKVAPVRQAYGGATPACLAAIDEGWRQLARALQRRAGASALTLLSDGQAAALAAAHDRGGDVLGVALGTSVAAGRAVGAEASELPPYASGVIVWPGEGHPHDVLGLRGSAQQGPTQKGLCGAGTHARSLRARLEEMGAAELHGLGVQVGELVAELVLGCGGERVLLMGRVVDGPWAGAVLTAARGALEALDLRLPLDVGEQAAFSQARAAALAAAAGAG